MKGNTEPYQGFLGEDINNALADLDAYSKYKTYSSNITDIIISALSETGCCIKVHYQDVDKSFESHAIHPERIQVGVIELAFIRKHYDLVVKSKHIKDESTGRLGNNCLIQDNLDRLETVTTEPNIDGLDSGRLNDDDDISEFNSDGIIIVQKVLKLFSLK